MRLFTALTEDNVLFSYEVHIAVNPEKNGEFLELCQSAANRFKQEKGYLALRIYRDSDHGHNYILVSQWESDEAMEHHLRGDTFSLVKGGAIVLGQKFTLKIGEPASKDYSRWERLNLHW